MCLTFQRESLSEFLPNAEALLRRHWQEIALNQDTVPLNINHDLYAVLEQSGALHIITARGPQLAGYAVYIVGPNLHYAGLYAESDVFFLAPEYRKGLAGFRMLRAAEKYLQGIGVQQIIQRCKVAHDCGILFERMGYKNTEKVYTRSV